VEGWVATAWCGGERKRGIGGKGRTVVRVCVCVCFCVRVGRACLSVGGFEEEGEEEENEQDRGRRH